jgi:hypothetical protein
MKIELRTLTPKEKLVYIDGEKAGMVCREARVASNSPTNTIYAWTGDIRHDGTTIRVGLTEAVGHIIPKIERLIETYEARKIAQQPIEEGDFINGLKDRVSNGIKDIAANAKDRTKHALGDKAARGKLDLRWAAKQLWMKWEAYAGRKEQAGNQTIRSAPTVRNLVDFLNFEYGLTISPKKLLYALNGGKKAVKAAQAAEQPQDAELATQTVESRLMALMSLTEAPEAAEDGEKAAPKLATPDTVTFDPRKAMVQIADMLIDAGVLTVSRNGQLSTGKAGGPDTSTNPANRKDDTGGKVISAEDGKKIAAKISDSGHHVDMKALSKALATKGVTLQQMDWLRNNISKPDHLKDIMLGKSGVDSKVGQATTPELLANVATSIANAITKVPTNGVNITSLGSTVDIDKMNELLKADGVNAEQIDIIRKAAQSEDELVKLLATGKDSALKPVFGLINAFLKASVKVQPEKKK